MIGAGLILLVCLGQTPAADPALLVERLGAPRYADREEAAASLERLGRRALPALRSARELKDPEVRSRAVALIDKIEGALLTQPTLVSLDYADRPLQEVVKDLSEQSGFKLALFPESAPALKGRRVTIHEPRPLPFWKAIDRLCETARLQYGGGMNGFPNGRDPIFPLFDGALRPTAPTVDAGPFRITLTGLHFQRDFNFQPVPFDAPGGTPPRGAFPAPSPGGTRPGLAVNEQFYAQIQVFAEPRLTIVQTGALKILEATDDKGQALATPSARNATVQRASGYFGYSSGPLVQLQASLARPDPPGKSIRKLRAVLPLGLATRKPDPLVVKLAGASGQTFRNEDVALTVHEVRPFGNGRQTSIELSVRPLASGASGLAAGAAGEFAIQRPDTFQHQIEVLDAQGRHLNWFQTSFDVEASRMSLTLVPQGVEQNPTATELRFYGMSRSTTEISFEFEDVPLP